MRRFRLAAGALALLGSTYALAPGTAAASDAAPRPTAAYCDATVEEGGPVARFGCVARCNTGGAFYVVVHCHTITGDPAQYYGDGPVVTDPDESWAYCFNSPGHVAFPMYAMVWAA